MKVDLQNIPVGMCLNAGTFGRMAAASTLGEVSLLIGKDKLKKMLSEPSVSGVRLHFMRNAGLFPGIQVVATATDFRGRDYVNLAQAAVLYPEKTHALSVGIGMPNQAPMDALMFPGIDWEQIYFQVIDILIKQGVIKNPTDPENDPDDMP